MSNRIAAVLVAALLVVGCGSGSSPQWTFPTTARATSPGASPPTSRPPASVAATGSASASPGAASSSPGVAGVPTGAPRRPTPSPLTVATIVVSAPVDPRSGGLDVVFGEWAVVPESTAIRPGKVTFVVKNGGQLTHGFEIEREDGEDQEFEIEGPEFDGGETVRISATLEPGTYEIYCYVGDHEERGMVALLVVRPDAPLVTAAPAAPAVSEVAISGFAFQPPALNVPAGTEVTWRNDDPADHTVTGEAGGFGSDTLGRGGTYSQRFDSPGRFAYICAIHPSMRGTIEVT